MEPDRVMRRHKDAAVSVRFVEENKTSRHKMDIDLSALESILVSAVIWFTKISGWFCRPLRFWGGCDERF
jgi:hypothetical protein